MKEKTGKRSGAPQVKIESDGLSIGRLGVRFHRTLRLPDDGNTYPLPPSLGAFPLRRVKDYASSVPKSWLEHGGVFLPMFQREAAWLSFSCPHYAPQALKVAVGMINAITGKPWKDAIGTGKQDYIVAPPQPWLDGINAGDDMIRQFVAMPLGQGYTVEGQVSGEEHFGGIQLLSFLPKRDHRFAAEWRQKRMVGRNAVAAASPGNHWSDSGATMDCSFDNAMMASLSEPVAVAAAAPASAPFVVHESKKSLLRSARPVGAEMGLAAGGRMQQAIYPDPYGADIWDTKRAGRVYVHIVNSALWQQITGEPAPPSPVTAATYAQHGMPWFDLYDEHLGDVAPSKVLSQVKSVKEMDADKGYGPQQDDSTVLIPEDKVVTTTAGIPAGFWPKQK